MEEGGLGVPGKGGHSSLVERSPVSSQEEAGTRSTRSKDMVQLQEPHCAVCMCLSRTPFKCVTLAIYLPWIKWLEYVCESFCFLL